jgi:hypothetical protein
MKMSRFKVVAILLLVVAVIAFGVAVSARKWPRTAGAQEKGRLKATDSLPPVTSQIQGIEVVSSFIDADGVANITVVNKTGKTIIGLGFASGNFTFTDDNGIAQDKPKPLIAPYGSYTVQQSASNLRANQPIRVSAVLYDDGSEDGDVVQRKHIHEERERQKEKRLREAKEAKP